MTASCAEDPHEVLVRDFSYGTHSRHRLDVWEPRSAYDVEGLRPAIIAIHGGAWRAGDKEWAQDVAMDHARRGYVVIGINYRLAPDDRWPAQIIDCQRALRTIVENAEDWRIDPERIGTFGVSAGGHLASMLALRPNPLGDEIACAVTANGSSDLTVLGSEPVMVDETHLIEDLLGTLARESLIDASPVSWVTRESPPIHVVHSTSDDNVYFSQGARLAQTLDIWENRGGFTIVEDDCHSSCWRSGRARSKIAAFFDLHLGADQ